MYGPGPWYFQLNYLVPQTTLVSTEVGLFSLALHSSLGGARNKHR